MLSRVLIDDIFQNCSLFQAELKIVAVLRRQQLISLVDSIALQNRLCTIALVDDDGWGTEQFVPRDVRVIASNVTLAAAGLRTLQRVCFMLPSLATVNAASSSSSSAAAAALSNSKSMSSTSLLSLSSNKPTSEAPSVAAPTPTKRREKERYDMMLLLLFFKKSWFCSCLSV